VKKRTIITAALLVGMGAQASVIVQWGEAGGANNIVGGSVFFDANTVTTSYSDSQADVIANGSYYNPNDGTRSPLFQVASSLSAFQSAQVQNTAAYDRFRLVAVTGAGTTRMETMAVWNDFLTSDNEVTSFGWYGYSAVADSADLRFIIKKSTGDWYASTVTNWTGSAPQAISLADASAASWFDFTPITAGTAAIGSEATIDMTDVVSVGFYIDQTDVGGDLAIYNGYFQTTAIPEPATLGIIAASGIGVLFIRRRFLI
jgi:hypothetical protein